MATSRQLALLRLEISPVNYLKCDCLNFELIQSKPSLLTTLGFENISDWNWLLAIANISLATTTEKEKVSRLREIVVFQGIWRNTVF